MGKRIEIPIGKQHNEEDIDTVEIDTAEIKMETPEEFFAMDKIELSHADIKSGVEQLDTRRLTKAESAGEIISAVSMANKEAHLSPEGEQVNQDQFLAYLNEKKGVFAAGVFDGMGGYNGGELASLKAKERFVEILRNFNRDSTREEIQQAVEEAITRTLMDLQLLGESNINLKKADTTFTVGIGTVNDGKYAMHIFHVGDSRAYLYQAASGKLEQITNDDSLANELEKSGELSAFQAKIHPYKRFVNNSLKHVGENSYQVYTLENLQFGEEVFFFTDGVTDQFREDGLEGERSNELQTYVRDYGLDPIEIVSAAELRKKQDLAMDAQQGKLYLSKDDDATVVKFVVPKLKVEISENAKFAILNDDDLKKILIFYINDQGVSEKTRESITEATIEDDIKKFREEYQTEDDFINNKGRELFFKNFESGNRSKYEGKMSVFQDLIFKE